MTKYIIELGDDEEVRDENEVSILIKYGWVTKKLIPYEEPEQEKPKRWRANEDDGYFVVDTNGRVGKEVERGEACDDWYYQSGNYFRTEKEAEEYKESIIVYNELRAYAEPDDAVWDVKEKHFYLAWNPYKKEIDFGLSVLKTGDLFFATKEAAQAAIEAVGAERVKKFYIGVKEQGDE